MAIGIMLVFGAMLLWQGKNKMPQIKKEKMGKGSESDFAVDLTAQARKQKSEPFFGREHEIERAMHILLRRTKNNPLLLGHPGVGKTAIVQGLAQKIVQGDVPAKLRGVRILALNLGSLMADAGNRGDLEGRLSAFVEELEEHPRGTILFIDEVHMLVQASGTQGGLNPTDMLKPALSRGELQVIGATTWEEYEKYIHPDAALDRRLQPVLVDEPSPEHALAMLRHAKDVYEEFHGVTIDDAALEAAVHLSAKKITNRYLPDKAIDIIDEAAAKVALECSRAENGKHFGALHAAARKCSGKSTRVTAKDVEAVINDWAKGDKEERKVKKTG